MLDDDDGGWEPSDNRVIRIGLVLYWLATSAAFLIVIFVIGDLYISWAQDRPILRVFALLIAVLIWLSRSRKASGARMHEREQHLRVLADKLLFVVEKNADGFALSRTADVSRPVQHQGLNLKQAEELLSTWKLRGLQGG